MTILVTIQENRTNKTYLTVNIKLYKTVYCAKGDIERKKELKDTDFEIKQVDVAGTHGKIISLDEKISLYRTKSIIRKGEALVSDLLEKIPIVRAGDRVKAYYLDGNIEVNFYVLAKQDGVEGDIIHVTKMDDNKQYKAKIVDSNNVLINE